MRKYIVMGVQGSGKGTQAKLLAEALDLEHISVGDIFRWNVEHHTKLGAQVRRIVAAGELVSDDLVGAVVRRRLDEHDWNFGFIIDGFPRNQPQARFFLESYDIDAVILLDVPDSVVEERILSRRLCSRCGLDYNLISHPACATTTPRPSRSWTCSAPRSSWWRSTPPGPRRRCRRPSAPTSASPRQPIWAGCYVSRRLPGWAGLGRASTECRLECGLYSNTGAGCIT